MQFRTAQSVLPDRALVFDVEGNQEFYRSRVLPVKSSTGQIMFDDSIDLCSLGTFHLMST